MEGKWTVDVALLISEVVFKQIMAIGVRANIQNIKLFIKDQSSNKFLKQFSQFKNMKNKKQPKEPSKDKLKAFVKDMVEKGVKIDLDLFGAFVARTAVVKRK